MGTREAKWVRPGMFLAKLAGRGVLGWRDHPQQLQGLERLPRRALTATEIVTRLAAAPGWKLTGDGPDVAIEKTYTFDNYYETMAFVNALAFAAHVSDHHPELLVSYNRCTVRWTT